MFSCRLVVFFILLLNSYSALANFAELYGASPATSGLSNQFTNNPSDPSNNYYVPSLLAFSKSIDFSYSIHYSAVYFRNINNITVQNGVNSNNAFTRGNIDLNYDPVIMNMFHLTLPIYDKAGPKLGLTLMLPTTGNHYNTLNPLTPEYYMYRARTERTVLTGNIAFRLSPYWAVSAGAYFGTKISGENNSVLASGSTAATTQSQVQAESVPTIAGQASIVGKFKKNVVYFAVQQEKKDDYEVTNKGFTSDSGNLTAFNYTSRSTMNYDPWTFRLGYNHTFTKNFNIYGTLEYQMWSNFETPILSITNNSGYVGGSRNFLSYSPRDILIPKIGTEFALTDFSVFRLGFCYMPSIFNSNFSGSGNLIDVDKYISSAGYGLKFKFFGEDAEWSSAVQWHLIPNDQVTKTPGQEDGNGAEKIGAPGYRLGGSIFAISTGIKMSLANLLR